MDADFVIIGLPASGKTTFLAALWHLVEAGEADCRLALASYEGDLAYLNRIAEAWRTFNAVPRTSQVGDADVIIELVDTKTGSAASAFFPDLAGETFDAQVEARRCKPELIERIANDDGILLFVSANVRASNLSIVEFNAMMPPDDTPLNAAAGPAFVDPVVERQAGAPAPASANAAEWEPKLLPPQVRLVQLLSDLLRGPFAPRRRRLAILVSAWDLVASMGLKPADWLAAEMPLVDQFLRTNAESFDYRIYGVSAQGLSLGDEAAIDVAAKLIPSRRIQIVEETGESHDLTSPLVWLMSTR
jgi:hypothetical protein